MKRIPFVFFLIFLYLPTFTQTGKTINLEDCLNQALQQHPFQQQPALLRSASQVRLDRIEAARLPSLDWKAMGSLQSETVKFPFDLPGSPGIDLPLYRLQTYVDASYLLYDGGARDAQKSLEAAQLGVQEQQIRVELDKIKPTVNQAYFQVLLLREQKNILEKSRQILQAKSRQLETGLKHGVVLESDVIKLKVEDLRLQSEADQTLGQIEGALATLGQLLGMELDTAYRLQIPDLDNYAWQAPAKRPEFELFTQQKQAVLASESMIAAGKRPKVAAFAQAGLGAPNPLNFFDESLSPYGMLGVNFSWKITDWKQADRDRQLLSLQAQIIDNQQVNFNYQLNIQTQQHQAAFAALERVINRDAEIVQLQEEILKQLSAQLDHGVITTSEYIEQVNQTTLARLNREAHRIQLQQTKAAYLILLGQL